MYPGDLNGIQDQYADLVNYGQSIGAGIIAVGEAGLQLLRYAAGEARVSGRLRTDGIFRGLGGLIAGAFATGGRPGSGSRPKSLMIYNSDTDAYEYNAGTDASPVWKTLGGGTVTGTLAERPAASSANVNSFYWASDQYVLYFSDGAQWIRIGAQPGDIFLTMTQVASPGRILLQGQAWPGTTGIYADLYAKWGGASLPDWRGRMPVVTGPHSDVSGIGNNDGQAAANRRPKHRTTNALAAGAGGNAGVPRVDVPGVGGQHGFQWVETASLYSQPCAVTGNGAPGGSIGTGVGTDALDTPSFIVCNVEAKL
jgi:hypothetical protein